MIELLPETGGRLIALKMSGTVTEEDQDQVLRDGRSHPRYGAGRASSARLGRPRRLGARARAPSGTWFGLHHRALIGRVAIIAEDKWADEAMRITDIFQAVPVRRFLPPSVPMPWPGSASDRPGATSAGAARPSQCGPAYMSAGRQATQLQDVCAGPSIGLYRGRQNSFRVKTLSPPRISGRRGAPQNRKLIGPQSRGLPLRENAMPTGTVKWFNATKGYGFIQPDDGSKDVFVHISAVERSNLDNLREGQKISVRPRERPAGQDVRR